MNEIESFIVGTITAFTFLSAVPICRTVLRSTGSVICAMAYGLWISAESVNSGSFSSELTVGILAGVMISVPYSLGCELFSSIGKSIDLLRGSQLAEQLTGEERSSPLESILELTALLTFLSTGGALNVIDNLRARSEISNLFRLEHQLISRSLANFHQVVEIIFPLVVLFITVEFLFAAAQRITRREVGTQQTVIIRLFLALVFLLFLPERIAQLPLLSL